MRKILSFILVTFFIFGLATTEAQAKRFGGGRSFGMQRSTSSFTRSRPTQSPLQPNVNRSRSWLAPLAGIMAGGLIASLFMGNGFGSGLLAWLAVGTVLLLVVRLLRPRTQPHYQTSNHSMYEMNRNQYTASQPTPLTSSAVYPTDFDSNAFLREAKVQFLRLQTANDNKNLNDIREFTTPEIFAEIQLQIQERDDHHNQTVVDLLDAELVDVSVETPYTIASVRFTGRIREENVASAINEIWHFRKEGFHWLVSGVQQA